MGVLLFLCGRITRIRHYGILASRNVGTKVAFCIKLAGVRPAVAEIAKHVNFCPLCGGVMLLLVLWVNPLRFRDGLCNWIVF
ncbi:MAG: hypothetical protein ACYDG6_01075 [Thermincolia bacterium]